MKKAVSPSLYLVAIAVLGFAPSAIADQCNPDDANCMELTSVGNGDYLGPAYVGPYVATIAGSKNVDVICDDFSTDSFLNTPWTFTTETAANISGAKFQSYGAAAYEEVAWLAEQLQYNPVGACAGLTTSNCQGDIQYAAWSIFDHSALSYISGDDLATANQLVLDAASHEADNIAFTIYTADPLNSSQEFIVLTPEPPALALLGVDLCGVIGAVFFFMRRGRKVVN
jgi:hypothetical protein